MVKISQKFNFTIIILNIELIYKLINFLKNFYFNKNLYYIFFVLQFKKIIFFKIKKINIFFNIFLIINYY